MPISRSKNVTNPDEIKIILAEDGDDHARILTAALNREGLKLLRFSDGLDAYEYLNQNATPDLFITDILMPGMTGFEILQKLNAENKMPPTIVLTSKQREEDILRALNYGVLDYLSKPFSPTIVIAKIKNILKASKAS